MGQNQSSEKPEKAPSRGASHSERSRERDRRVHRRISVQALGTPRRDERPVDASATTATAQGTTTHNLDTANLERMLQSTSPELSSKSNRLERSTSRKKKEQGAHMTPQPLPIPGPAAKAGINIPTSTALPTRSRTQELEDDGDPHFVPVSSHRPPRLPLPIAEIPDSPNIGATAGRVPTELIPDIPPEESILPRRNSMLSEATQDEEDVGEELQPFGVGFTGETVPYTIEWNQPAKTVFVTGTFAAWDKKYRLRRSDTHPGHFKTVINLPPGTHHLKFFVDNNMVTSPDLPTAVDFNNILVNYIEISTDDIPKRDGRRESGSIPVKQQPYPTSPRPEGVPEEPTEQYSGTVTPGEGDDFSAGSSEQGPEEIPEGDFRQIFPQALIDVDFNEDTQEFKDAWKVIQDSGNPPSLPLFLSRSILNAGPNVGVKDDSSVLAMPNHTVLNHLMTSNVRNGVLATSVTTRYKKKYVTTISFKPVPKSAPYG